MEPLKGGRLALQGPPEVKALWDAAPAKRTPAEWALRYVWDEPGVNALLSGMSTMEQVVQNVEAAEEGFARSLTVVERKIVTEVTKAYQERARVACDGCRACMPCPAGIDIPLVLGLLNNAALYETLPMERGSYGVEVALGNTARVGGCDACGQCTKVCPRNLDIPLWLERCSLVFE
jgi:predicted aldo/keto reductase-like oxidoreductase